MKTLNEKIALILSELNAVSLKIETRPLVFCIVKRQDARLGELA